MQANAIIALIVAALMFSVGWTVSSWHSKSGYTKTLEAALEQQKQDMDKANTAAIDLEKKRAAAETKSKDTQKKLDAYLKAKPPSECFDNEALGIFNDV